MLLFGFSLLVLLPVPSYIDFSSIVSQLLLLYRSSVVVNSPKRKTKHNCLQIFVAKFFYILFITDPCGGEFFFVLKISLLAKARRKLNKLMSKTLEGNECFQTLSAPSLVMKSPPSTTEI